jgi:NADPH-dependent 2,4-dienoyl-CoA reductase/sulfur reductase-like enzyme
VIVGGGLAGARVVEAYREAGGDAPITIISQDNHPPYHRPPLSKRLLRGEIEPEGALVAPKEAYAEKNADLRLETTLTGLDLAGRELVGAGGRIPFGTLVIASGAWPNRLDVPGFDLPGVHTLRTIDNSLAIRDEARKAKRAVVVGTGFIGMETSASLRTLGVEVTILDKSDLPFRSVHSKDFSEHLARRAREEGVELLNDPVAEFRGDGRLTSAVSKSGRELEADLAIVGVGVTPLTGWLDGSGLTVEDGVHVDEYFRTGVDGVYAIGDVARFHDPIFKRSRRIEHWSNADYQGKQLGKLLAGEDAPYDKVSTFFTEIFGRVYKVFGDASETDEQRLEGSFDDGEAIVYYLAGGRLRATLHTGQSEEREAELLEQIRNA